MSTGPIVFRIQDGVDPQIAQNVAAIGNAARQADSSVQVLTQSLQAIQNTGVAGLAQQLSATSSSTTRLSNTTAKMSAAALDASQKIDLLVQSYNKLSTAVATAISTLNSFAAAAKTASSSTVSFNQNVNNLGRGSGQAAGNFIASSAALQTLEGHFGSNTRAAGRFLTSVLGLGPVLQAAFPVFGAIALIGALGTMIGAIDKVATHLHNLTVEAQKDAIAILNSNLQLIKGEHGIGTSIGNFLVGRPNAPDLKVPDPSKDIREINFALQIVDLEAQKNQFGKQGLELQKAKVESVQDEITATKVAIDAIRRQRDLIQNNKGTGLLDQTINTPNRSALIEQGIAPSTIKQSKIPVDSDQWKELTANAKQYDDELDRLNKQLLVLQQFKLPQAQAKEPFAAAKDEAKAARQQIKDFSDALVQLKTHQDIFDQGSHTDTALEQQLNLLNNQLGKALPQNLDALHARIEAVNNQLAEHRNAVAAVNEKLHDGVSNIGLYSDALKESNEIERIVLELRKKGVVVTQDQINAWKELIHQTVSQQLYQTELKKVYEEFNNPLKEYQAKLDAINKLEKDGAITHAQALIALNEANKSYKDAINPLNEYVHGLENEVNLLGRYGIAATVAAEIQKVQNDLRNKGRALTANEVQQLTDFLTKLEKEKELQQAVNKLYQENAGAVQKLTTSILALNQARQKGIITEQQYDTQLAKLRVDLANINIEMGKFTKADVLTSVFGGFIKDFKGLTVGIVQTWQQAFDTIANGAATALGRAIAYGENLGAALKDVARQALSELIAGFIKLGIQLLISTIIQRTAGQTAADESIALAAAVGSAWAPAAAFASLASFGANAAPADIALGSTVAFAQLLSAIKLNSGGIVPGYGNKDTVPALLTPGEGVLNQAATRFFGPSTIQAWNRGQYGVSVAGTGTSATARQSLVLNLIHDKNAVDVVQINEDTIRVVAKQEAAKAVSEQSPHVISAQIAQPSSPVRKSLALHTNVRGAH
jgi:hypothetical protein